MTASAPDDEKLRRVLLRRRLEAFAIGPSLALVPSFTSICVLLALYAGAAASPIRTGWAATGFLIISATSLIGQRVTPDAADVTVLERQWRAVNIGLVLCSLAWSIGLSLAAWLLPAQMLSAFAIVGAALFGSTLSMHRTAPVAAIVQVVFLGSGLALAEWLRAGWQSWPVLVFILVFAMTLIAAIRVQDRRLILATRTEFDRRQSEKTIRMLLDDREVQAADWLWTVGADGNLLDVSERLAAVLQTTPDALEGKDFLLLLEPGRERERVATLIAERTVFRDEPVPAYIDGNRRTWRLSGHPGFDGRMSGTGRDVTDQPPIAERVRAMAQIDPLTGLANRQTFDQRLREALVADGTEPQPVALLTLDLDDFKAVNNSHGHPFGELLLREMGARLRRGSRQGDLVSRLGGDEFAVLVETPGGDGLLMARAHRLLAAAREPFRIEGQSVRISTSVGIARSNGVRDAEELMRRVDLALYAAKAKGRDQLAIFDDALDRAARDRRNLEHQLRDAIGRGQMLLHYQPIITLQTGTTVGYEGLLRWHHPDRGILMPDDFLPVAEETGLIVALGDWMIRRALADVADWPGAFRLALNLSSSQTRNSHLIATVDAALAASGISAERLEFAIAEHAPLHDTAVGDATLDRLRVLGAEIALDNFGTGYSSLGHLRRYRFDRIKIDRSFVRDIETSDEAQAIVSAITRLAQALGMRTTANGVERPGQLDLLRKLGCDEAQGFLILKPVEVAAIAAARASGLDLPTNEIEDYREARQALAATPGTARS